MRLRHKLTLWLLLFGGLMLSLMLWSNHTVLHSTLLQYVHQRDQARLQRLQHNIEHYLQLSHTDSLNKVPQTVWLRLLNLSHRVDLTQTDIPLEFLVRHKLAAELTDKEIIHSVYGVGYKFEWPETNEEPTEITA